MIQFFVPGTCVPKGSARAFKHPRSGAVITMQSNREKVIPWESRIASFAIQAGVKEPSEGPVRILLTFNMERPKNHYTTKGLRPEAPRFPISRPDADKLARCACDALTGIAYKDDSQVVELVVSKVYATSGPGVHVTIDEPPPVAVLMEKAL